MVISAERLSWSNSAPGYTADAEGRERGPGCNPPGYLTVSDADPSMLIRAEGMYTAGVPNRIVDDISPERTLSQSTRIEGRSHVSAPASMSARGRP